MLSLVQDSKYLLRHARRRKGFILITVLIVALGVSVNAGIFSVIRAILFPSLPVGQEGQLVEGSEPVNGPTLDALTERREVFSGVLGWYSEAEAVNDFGSTASEYAALVSGGAFQTLQIHAASGRLLEASDDQPGGGEGGWKCVLSYSFWKSHFHGDVPVEGKIIKVDGRFVTVIGVTQENFDGLETGIHPALYLPLEFNAGVRHRPYTWGLTFVGRLQNGVSLQAASNYLKNVREELGNASSRSDRHSKTWRLIHLRDGGGPMGRYFRRQYRLPLLILQTLAILILVLCCISVAWLFSAQIAGMRSEFSMRLALGASRWRLWRPVLLQQLFLSGTGMIAGLVLAKWTSSAAAAKLALAIPGASIVSRFDWLVFGFAGLAALGTVAWPTLITVLSIGEIKIGEELRRQGSLGTGAKGPARLNVLLPVQITMATALTVGALLLGTTLFRLLNQNFGFDSANVLNMQLDFTSYGVMGERTESVYRQLFDRLHHVGGISSFSIQSVPVLHDMHMWASFDVHGANGITRFEDVYINAVGANYFRTLGTRVLVGRDFKENDRNVAILNQSAAQKFFSSENPVGKYISDANASGLHEQSYKIIAVVEDSKYDSIRSNAPATVYLPFTMSDTSTLVPAMQLVVRTSHAGIVEKELNEILKQLAPEVPFNPLVPYEQEIADATARERILAELSVMFSGLSLLMTAAGLYGTLSYQTKCRTGEIGLRFAMGASKDRIAKLFIRQTCLEILPGSITGLIVGFILARSMRSLLYGVDAQTPWVYCICLLLIIVTTGLAIYGPIRRASSVDPMQALRFW